jgi:hypothetical protein
MFYANGGSDNSAFGAQSLSSNSGSGNNAFGNGALYNNTTGSLNTGMGYSSLDANTTGNRNTGFGFRSLNNNSTGNNNTALGDDADVATGDLNNAMALGSGAIVAASNQIQLGNSSVTNVKTSGTLTAGSITYPNVSGTNGQVLTTDGNGTATWATPSASAGPKFVRSFTQTDNKLVVDCVAESEVSIGNLTFSIKPISDANGVAVNGGGANLVVKSSIPGDYQFISNLGNGSTDQRLFSVSTTNQNVSNLLLNYYSTLTSTIFKYYIDGNDSYEVKASMDGGQSVLLVVTYYKM